MEKLYTTHQAAKKLNLSYGTLKVWRCLSRGPSFVKLGNKAVRYKESELLNFINKKEKK